MAMSLDGRTATAPGDSPWISGPESRELVHRWRAEHDAIAVGIGTALADDPLLTARVNGARQPMRVVFDSQARMPLESQLLATLDQAPVLIITAPNAPADRSGALRDAGAEVVVATEVESALRELGRREVTSLFLEGGRTLASGFLAAGQIDESRTFIAPMLLGGSEKGSEAGARVAALESTTEQVGEDILVRARFKEW
jgi:diaminohydroxyphosphoribosylaminopyrimidine deaminase / 5-amino-6-(5-phosphoribosylamino)uracil reductase